MVIVCPRSTGRDLVDTPVPLVQLEGVAQVNLSLGIYDVFANAIPGSLYLVATLYVSIRLGWIDLADLTGLDTTFALASAALASYLLGQVLGSSLRRLVELLPLWRRSVEDVRTEFLQRNPTLADRPLVEADHFTLLAGLRQRSPEAATEVDRSRAAGLMLRSASPAFLIGAVVAFVEAIVSGRAAAVASGIGLVVLAVLSLYEGHKRSRWAYMHTFECAVWMAHAGPRVQPPD